jgi:hypothetical protein
MFRSLFHDHLQGPFSVLSAFTTFQLPASSFVSLGLWPYALYLYVCPVYLSVCCLVVNCMPSICICVRCTCLCFVWSWTVCPLFVCVNGVPVCVLSGRELYALYLYVYPVYLSVCCLVVNCMPSICMCIRCTCLSVVWSFNILSNYYLLMKVDTL